MDALENDEMTFASDEDYTRYNLLDMIRRDLQTQLRATLAEMAAISHRAYWSPEAILRREG